MSNNAYLYNQGQYAINPLTASDVNSRHDDASYRKNY